MKILLDGKTTQNKKRNQIKLLNNNLFDLFFFQLKSGKGTRLCLALLDCDLMCECG